MSQNLLHCHAQRDACLQAQAAESNWQLLHQGLPQANCLDPRQGEALAQAALSWGEQLMQWSPFSAVLLGMGEDGHIASLFPAMPGLLAALDPDAEPAALPALAPQEPRERLSLNLAMLQRGQW